MNDDATVHIIDDDELLCNAISLLLHSVGIKSCIYGSVREFLDAHERGQHGSGCIVLDVRLPGISGLDFQTQLASLGIELPIILMTGYGDVPMSVRAMKSGAVDFLPKPFRDQDMLDAVSVAIERDQKRRAEGRDTAVIHEHFATLSVRERQVMTMVTAGKMNKQVAFDLGLSEITVKTYRGVAMRKMGARTLADLVRMAGTLKLETI